MSSPDAYEWVEILEPESGKKMYANVASGDCLWDPPAGMPVKASHANQWWELVDASTSRSYYYNAASHATVWERPVGGDIIPLARLQQMQEKLAQEEAAAESGGAPSATPATAEPQPQAAAAAGGGGGDGGGGGGAAAAAAPAAGAGDGPPRAPTPPLTPAKSTKKEREVAEDLESCGDLNQHKKGFIFKRPVSLATMLAWSKDIIPSPMLMTIRKTHRKNAIDLFKLVQMAMGDRGSRGRAFVDVATAIVAKAWAETLLRDELYLQLCKQTTGNPNGKSEELGWELLSIAVSFFPPSNRFFTYLEGYVYRHVDADAESKIAQYAEHCLKKLDRARQAGARRGNDVPSKAEVEVAQKNIFNPSLFGSTLDEVMDVQDKAMPGLELPWVVTALAEEVLRKKGAQTEGIFRVPGDSDAVNSLKVALNKFKMQDVSAEPHVPASALKLWFRELQDPLISEEFYETCIAADDASMAVATLDLLPELNRKVLMYIIRFLQVVAQPENQTITKMNHDNLAMVWAPNFLRCPSNDPQIIFLNTKREMVYVRYLVNNLDTAPVAHLGLNFNSKS